jgi:hypothetical protein
MTKNQFACYRGNFLLAFIAGSFFIGVAHTSANVTQDLSEMRDLSHCAVLSLDNNGLPLSGPAAVATDVTVSGSAVPQGILMANSSTVRLSAQSETIGAIVANRIVMSNGSSVTHPPVQSP